MSKVLLALLVCFVLTGLNIYQFYSFSEFMETQHKMTAVEIELSKFTDKASNKIDKASLQIIAEKPLFSPDRKPFVKTKVIQAENTTLESKSSVSSHNAAQPLPELLGILKMNEMDVVFFVVKGKSEPVILKTGDDYEGWTVTEINASQVVLSKDNEEKILEIVWYEQMGHEDTDKLLNPVKTVNVPGYQSGSGLKDRLSRIMR